MNKTGSLVAHFNGKFMQDVIGSTKVDRIAILVSYNGTATFIVAPKITLRCYDELSKSQNRDDYKELLQLELLSYTMLDVIGNKFFEKNSIS